MIEKSLEYLESIIQEKMKIYDWKLEIELSHLSYGEKKYYYSLKLYYAPKEWSNGTTEWSHISEHLVKGLDFDNQPMTLLKFESIEKLMDWLKEK